MKKLLYLTFIISFMTSSCGDFTQEMWLESDGSGQLHFAYDMGELFAFFKMMDEMGDSTQTSDEVPDFASHLLDKLGSSHEAFDTTMSLYELLSDDGTNIEDPENLKNIHLQVQANQSKESVLMKLKITFKSFAHLDEMIHMLDSGKSEGLTVSASDKLPEFSRHFNFHKKGFEIKKYKLGGINGENAPQDDMPDMDMEQLLQTGNFIQILHFPYQVKACSNKNSIINGKTVTITQPLSEIAKMKEYPGLIVKFKKN